MLSGGNAVFKLVGGIFFAVGLGLLVGAWVSGNRQYTILKSWPSTDAEVVRSRVISYRDREGTTLHRAAIDFRYAVNGKEYTTAASSNYSSSSYPEMKRKVDRYAPGTRQPIKYNPADPGDLRFDVGYSFGFFFLPVLLGGMGIVFAGLGGTFLMVARKVRSLLCPSCGQTIQRTQNFCPNCAAPIAQASRSFPPS